MKRAVYPGSFDPFTNGHLDIVRRSLKIFDSVVVLVADNYNKTSLFTPEERVLMIKKTLSSFSGVTVDYSSLLVVDYAEKNDIEFIIRGIRDTRDLSYEMELEANNKYLAHDIETVYLAADKNNLYTRSSSIREFIKYRRDCREFLPKEVYEEIEKKYSLK